jgi:hypothetical protein
MLICPEPHGWLPAHTAAEYLIDESIDATSLAFTIFFKTVRSKTDLDSPESKHCSPLGAVLQLFILARLLFREQ